MKELMIGGRGLALDFASSIFFFTLYALTGNLLLAVGLGMAVALAQIVWRLVRRETIDALQWISVITVAAAGAASLIAYNPMFVMLKPSVIYLLTGCAMLQRGWMLRYMPPRAVEYVSDLIIASGYMWAGLMFVSAMLNIILAMSCTVLVWGTAMTVWSIASKTALFFGQYYVMRSIGHRRASTKTGMSPAMLLAAGLRGS